jgi:hypothetical protein
MTILNIVRGQEGHEFGEGLGRLFNPVHFSWELLERTWQPGSPAQGSKSVQGRNFYGQTPEAACHHLCSVCLVTAQEAGATEVI